MFSRFAPFPSPAAWSASTSDLRQNVRAGAISLSKASGVISIWSEPPRTSGSENDATYCSVSVGFSVGSATEVAPFSRT